MSVPNEVMQAFTEAKNRGILTPEQDAAYEELVKRGVAEEPQGIPLFQSARESGFLKGYLDQAAGIAQLVSRLAPDSRPPEIVLDKALSEKIPPTAKRIDDFISREEVEYQKARKERGEEGIDWARLGGGIVNPVSLGTMRLSTAATIPKRILAGGGYGAATAMSMPVSDKDANFALTKAAQAGIGGTIGMAVPSAAEAVKGAWNLKRYLTRPFSDAGRMKDLQDMYIKLAGEAKDDLIQALNNTKTYVFGNKPTSGQSIAGFSLKEGVNVGGSIVRLEQDLAKKSATGDPLKTVLDKQVQRRASALASAIDASDQGLKNAENLRTAITRPLYDSVKTSSRMVKTEPVVARIQSLIKENSKQDSIAVPLRKLLRSIYTTTDQGPKLERNPGTLYSMSKNIRDMMNKKTPGGQNEYDVMALSQIKKLLDKQIASAEPNYKEAQKLFKEYSEPINQIKVMRTLGGALKSAVEKERPTPFLNAIKDAPKTLKKSTGFARYEKLEDVLNKDQIRIVDNVKKELLRQSKAKEMAAGTESTYGFLKEGIEPQLPNMLSRPALLTNAVLRTIGKDMGPKYEKLAVKLQENPELLAELMRRGTDDTERKLAYELLTTLAATAPIRTLATEAQVSTQNNEE